MQTTPLAKLTAQALMGSIITCTLHVSGMMEKDQRSLFHLPTEHNQDRKAPGICMAAAELESHD